MVFGRNNPKGHLRPARTRKNLVPRWYGIAGSFREIKEGEICEAVILHVIKRTDVVNFFSMVLSPLFIFAFYSSQA